MRQLKDFFKYQMLKEAEMQNHPPQSVKETQTGTAAAEAAPMVPLLHPFRLMNSPQLKRKDEETTLKQLQEFLVVKQREIDSLKQQLEEEAIQRLQRCQRQDQHCKEIEKLTEEMKYHVKEYGPERNQGALQP